MSRPHKITKVVHRKLGRYWGMAHPDSNKIEIDERLTTYRHLLYMIHEVTHLIFPEMSETEVKKVASKYAKFLWQNKFRWVDM